MSWIVVVTLTGGGNYSKLEDRSNLNHVSWYAIGIQENSYCKILQQGLCEKFYFLGPRAKEGP